MRRRLILTFTYGEPFMVVGLERYMKTLITATLLIYAMKFAFFQKLSNVFDHLNWVERCFFMICLNFDVKMSCN